MFNTSTRQPIVTFDRHNDDLSLWFYKVFQKLNFMCFLKKQKHEKISRGVFTNIPAVHSIESIIRHVHVLFYNNREIAAVRSVRSDGPVCIYFGSIPLD